VALYLNYSFGEQTMYKKSQHIPPPSKSDKIMRSTALPASSTEQCHGMPMVPPFESLGDQARYLQEFEDAYEDYLLSEVSFSQERFSL
jgi:hypothetical protein